MLHYGGGSLQSKEYTLFHLTGGDPAEVLSAFVKQYYAQRGAAPKIVLLSHEIEDADAPYLNGCIGCSLMDGAHAWFEKLVIE